MLLGRTTSDTLVQKRTLIFVKFCLKLFRMSIVSSTNMLI